MLIFLFLIIIKLSRKIKRRIYRSMGLPSSESPEPIPNQIPKPLLLAIKNQIVGTHNAREASGNCLWSRYSRKSTKRAHRVRATIDGIRC